MEGRKNISEEASKEGRNVSKGKRENKKMKKDRN